MKKIYTVCALAGALSCGALSTLSSTQAASKKVVGRSVAYAIPKIHCAGCGQTITTALKKQPGYLASRLDLKKKVFTVSYDPAKTSPAKIEKAIEKTGFPATPIKAAANVKR